MITCLAKDGKTIRKGAKNCWAHWVNKPVLVGADINNKQAKMNDDYFVWLTTEGITCPAGTGLEKCKQKKANPCTSSRITRMKDAGMIGAYCVPTFTWEDKK